MADDHGGGAGAEPVWAGGADALPAAPRARPARPARAVRQRDGLGDARRSASLTALRARARTTRTSRSRASRRARRTPRGAPPIVTREQWGAASAGRRASARRYGTVQAAFVHHTVNANDYGPQDSAAIVRAICRYHRTTKRLARHRLQLPRRPLRADLRGPRGRDRPGRHRRAGAGLQRRLDGRREHRHVQRRRRRRPTPCTRWPSCWRGSSRCTARPCEGQVTVLSRGGPTNRYRAGHAR